MAKSVQIGIIICGLVHALFTQPTITLSGTVKNQADFAVGNLEVVLAGQNLRDTTDKDGAFEIIGQVTSISSSRAYHKPSIELLGTQLQFSMSDVKGPVSFYLYSLSGRNIATLRSVPKRGHQKYAINLEQLLKSASSMVLTGVIQQGDKKHPLRIVKSGSRQYSVKGISYHSDASSIGTRAVLPVLDSLKFFRTVRIREEEKVLLEYSFAVEKWKDSYKVILDLIPYEAVDFGVKEFRANRIWPDEVGTRLTEYPRAIKNFLRKTGPGPHDYEWWCSEYYSYALRVGNCPLYSASSNPNWMIDGNTYLRTWFRNNSKYIYKNSIGSFKPLPGDFCHIKDHAAMVWYVDDKDTIYTVEANGDLDGDGTFDNKLALVKRGHYKTFKDLLGYGKRTGETGSSHQSISKK